jgi:hypothetical protein
MLTGLIIACEDVAGGTTLRAELPVAGQTVLEQQVRLLDQVGAERVIAIAERLTEALAAAVNRLRRDGITIEVVRQVEDVAQRVTPDERLLVLADGVVTDQLVAERLLSSPAPAILTLPDRPDTGTWELIDATARWAGLLLVDGDLVRRTARMLGDWDLQSTLLRNAVQAGAARIDASGVAPLLAQVSDAAAALAVEQAISRGAARRYAGLMDRYVFDPLARAVAPRAMSAMVDPAWLRAGASGLLMMAALVLVGGWRWPGLVLAMLAGPVDTLGRHLASLTMRLRRENRKWTQLRYGTASAALLALGWNLRDLGWGTVAIAVTTLGVMTALFEHERWIGRPPRRPLWLAEPDLLVWLLLPFAIGGWWATGLAAQAGLAFASLLVVQRLTGRQP